jgi:integrase
MTDVGDIQNFERKFENQLEKVHNAEISEADREAILDFTRHIDAKGRATSTITNRINQLRLSSERAEADLTEMSKTDVDKLLFSLKHDYDLSEGSLRNYRKSLRLFFRFMGEDWADDIEIGASPDRDVEPNELLTSDETDQLLDAARNPRDKALLALLLDTGLRIGAIGSVRISDVELTDRAGFLTINQDADGTKDASGTVPITWSRSYIVNWLDVHPAGDDPSAPVIHSLKEPDNDDSGALSYVVIQRQLKRIADRTDDVPRDKVNPHNFRKTAISRWVREGLSEQEIKHRAMWVQDSTQFEVYSAVRDEELNDQILDQYGLAEEDLDATPTLESCPQCGTGLRDDARFCPSCGLALSDEAAASAEEMEDRVMDSSLGHALGDSEFWREFGTMLRHNPDARATVAEMMPSDDHS